MASSTQNLFKLMKETIYKSLRDL